MNFGNMTFRTAQCDIHGQYEQRVMVVPNVDGALRQITSVCPKCALAELQRAGQVARNEDKTAALSAAIERAGIPQRFVASRLENFGVESDEQRHVLAIAKRYCTHHAGGILVFSGPPGTGKTTLAAAIVARFIATKRSARYMLVLEAVRYVRDTYRRDSDRSETQALRDLCTVDLLVLDEIGVQRESEEELRIIFEVLSKRHAACRPTLLLSNLDQDKLNGILGARLKDRLHEGGAVVPFPWESFRGRR